MCFWYRYRSAIAAFHDHAAMVELLLKHGADPALKNSFGKDALAMAKASRADASVEVRWFDSKLQVCMRMQSK